MFFRTGTHKVQITLRVTLSNKRLIAVLKDRFIQRSFSHNELNIEIKLEEIMRK